jgi:hypothetical protein
MRELPELDPPQKRFLKTLDVDAARATAYENGQECDACGECFRTPTLLERHEARAHGTWKYMCKYCHGLFGSSESRSVHVQTFHHQLGAMRCRECGKTFRCRKYFGDHACAHRRRALKRMGVTNSELDYEWVTQTRPPSPPNSPSTSA